MAWWHDGLTESCATSCGQPRILWRRAKPTRKDRRTSKSVGSRYTNSHTICTSSPRWGLWLSQKSIKLLHYRKYSSKGVSFSVFICTFAMSFWRFCYTCFAALRLVKNLTWQNSEQLFVAQVLIKMLTHRAAEIRIKRNVFQQNRKKK